MKLQIKIILCLLLLSPILLQAQSLSVKGRVTDFRIGEPIVGASVAVKGTVITTVTNQDGAFSLSGVPKNATLVFSFLGRETQEVALNRQTTLNVEMRETASNLDEVVVIGYGTQEKRDVTGSITSMSAADMEANPGGTIESALEGRIPGMQIVTTAGEPRAGSNMNISGASSTDGGRDPLYLPDGVLME